MVTTGTASRSLGMGHPEVAAEVEVEAGLGEVLSKWQLRRDSIIWPILGSLHTSGGWKSDNLVASLGYGQSQEPM